MSKKRSRSGSFSTADNPIVDGKSSRHRPRRNYWGNLKEEDTYQEEHVVSRNYDYSDYDPEDDASSYYENDGYD